jgi:hypothetical protein
MSLSDFDYLLRDCRTAVGLDAFVPGVAKPIRGRFRIDTFLVPGSPSDVGLRVTETWFYYDVFHDLPEGVLPLVQGDQIVIQSTLYEVADIFRDDIGEHALQLLRGTPRLTFWDGGATVWDDDETVWRP